MLANLLRNKCGGFAAERWSKKMDFTAGKPGKHDRFVSFFEQFPAPGVAGSCKIEGIARIGENSLRRAENNFSKP